MLKNQLKELLHERHTKTNSTTITTERLSNEVSILSKQFSALDLRQQLFQNTSFDEKLVWKINNITLRMQQAVSGCVSILHSAPVFTDK